MFPLFTLVEIFVTCSLIGELHTSSAKDSFDEWNDGTPVTSISSAPTMQIMNKYFLNFGNYEEALGTPCDYDIESDFFKNLTSQSKSQFLRETWNNDLMVEDLQQMCNRFKYLRCDKFTNRCVCGVQHTFWSPFDRKSRIHGKCRIKLGVKAVCDNNTQIRWKFRKPFTSQVLQVEFDKAFTPEPIVNSTCLVHRGRQYLCEVNKTCITGSDFLEFEFKKLRKAVDDSQWNFRPNYLCNSSLIYALTRDGHTPYGFDFELIRRVIRSNATAVHCNPLTYKECRFGICDCPVGPNGEHLLYTLEDNKCIVGEGGSCSRSYWFNGNWETKRQQCAEGLNCRPVDNDEKVDYICCDAEKDKQVYEGIGKCKSLLSGGLRKPLNKKNRGSTPSRLSNKFTALEFFIGVLLVKLIVS